MMRKILCLILSAVMLLCAIPVLGFEAAAASELKTSDSCIDMLKAMEGFSAKPYWDYSQYSVGYGTRCPDEDYDRYMAEGIPEEEADALLREYVATSEDWLNNFADKYSLTFTQGQFDALILFTYNCGTGWMSKSGDFRQAVIDRKTGNDFIYQMCRWCNAGGDIQTSLVNRRLREANIYLNEVYSMSLPSNYGYVRYDGNGGKTTCGVQGFDANLNAVPLVTAATGKDTFDGWYTAQVGGTKVTKLTESLKGKTLYAHWANGAGAEQPEKLPEETTAATEPETQPETKPAEKDNTLEKPVKIKVTGDYVNIRKGPGTGYDVVTTVTAGKEMTITEVAEGSGYTWGKYDGGWICLKYTNFDEAVAAQNKPEQKPETKPEEKPTTETKPTESKEPETKPKTEMGTVYNATSLRIRSGAGTSYSIVGYLSSGARVEILEKKNAEGMQWGKIKEGWICMDYVKLDAASAESGNNNAGTSKDTVIATGKVVGTDELRVRSGAGLDNAVVGTLARNTKVEIYEKASASGMVWGRISKGWISLDYVQLDTNNSTTVIDRGVVVNTDSLRIRSAAGTSNSIVGYLSGGTRVEIYEKTTVSGMVWGRIDKGWISLDYVKMDTASGNSNSGTGNSGSGSEKTMTVTASSLRIRSAAGTSNEIVGYLSNGTKVTILETTTVDGVKWGRIDKGWISMEYVA